MKKFFSTGILIMALALSITSCREENKKSDVEELMEEPGAEVKVKDDKIKVKTDDKKIKVKKDDDGDIKKKVKVDNDDI